MTIDDLPRELVYVVREDLTDVEKRTYETTVQKSGLPAEDPDEAATSLKQSGIIGLYDKIEAGNAEPEETSESIVAYTNSRKGVVCKITNINDQLVQYKDENGNLVNAVFETLEEAVNQINEGLVHEGSDPARDGALKLKLLKSDYELKNTLTLDAANRNGVINVVILTTAGINDTDGYPYNAPAYPWFEKVNNDDHDNRAHINRAFNEGSMIVANCPLTLDTILLNGKAQMNAESVPKVNGGIIHMNSTGSQTVNSLTVNSKAKLQNSIVDGNGGAIYLENSTTLIMNGEITACMTRSGDGGAVYADGTGSITLGGLISSCTADNGGAVYANTGKSITVKNGTRLIDNTATNNGGAICSEANVTVEGGSIGEVNAGNTAKYGGGVYMGDSASFTMTGGSISYNTANGGNGGGLFVKKNASNATQIRGGNISHNIARAQENEGGQGGAIFVAEGAKVSISGNASIAGNGANLGGAVYDQGDVTMSAGTISENHATIGGGAVYVTGGHSFAMSGGSITGNYSPQGAVSTGDAVDGV